MKKLGFGLMRPPMLDREIDIEQLKQMVDVFMERGFTYFDTAYGYLEGRSETAAKLVLTDRYPRESFQLATKLPVWEAKDAASARQMIHTSLKRTGAGYFDYYLLHNLGGSRTAQYDAFGLWDFLQECKQQGLVRKTGFSFHDKADVLDQILTAHPEVDFVQLQINYADWDSESIQSGLCYNVARKHGKPIIIMEPVKGGSLASLPASIAQPMLDYAPKASLSSWAVRYAASLEGVFMVLSGMSTLDQVQDNTRYMQHFEALNAEERAVIAQVQKKLSQTSRIPCTDCRYCLKDCPRHIPISSVFNAVNLYHVYNDLSNAKRKYAFYTSKSSAADCIACGQCESVCPQGISIVDLLRQTHELLG